MSFEDDTISYLLLFGFSLLGTFLEMYYRKYNMISGEGGLVNECQTRRGLPKETDKPLIFCATAVETRSTLGCLQSFHCVNKNELSRPSLWGLSSCSMLKLSSCHLRWSMAQSCGLVLFIAYLVAGAT